MEFATERLAWEQTYKLLTVSILPRPIAWVSTIDGEGQTNLAPFSFFTAICPNPPLVCFAPMRRGSDGGKKDTLRNIATTGEFVINLVTDALVERMNRTSEELPPGVSEFEVAGVTAVPSLVVKPPRVGESPVHLECRVVQIMDFGDQPGGGSLVIGRVLRIHVRDDLVLERNHVDMVALDAVGRMGGDSYTRTTDQFRLQLPPL